MNSGVWRVVVCAMAVGAAGSALVGGAVAGATAPPTDPPPTPTAPPATTATSTPPTAPPTAPPTTAVPTTTLPPLPPGIFNPACARLVQAGDSISLLADQIGNGTTIGGLLLENGFGSAHVLHPGDVIDSCVDNGVNDLNGASRLRPPTALIADADPAAVMAQQEKLNALLVPLGYTELAVDGQSGPRTRQALCAARVLLGLPISRSDMAAGSEEEAKLMALPAAPVPPGAPVDHQRWGLIDMTCQVAFFGEGASTLTFVFPTSTGQAGFETRVVAEATSFRFDPAIENGGWHDSSEFPAAYDNPLNGNMYKPIYFNNGQAIHGANNVPPQPASKGCVRLSVANQDRVVAWLGLAGATGPVWAAGRINLRVTTQGSFSPDP